MSRATRRASASGPPQVTVCTMRGTTARAMAACSDRPPVTALSPQTSPGSGGSTRFGIAASASGFGDRPRSGNLASGHQGMADQDVVAVSQPHACCLLVRTRRRLPARVRPFRRSTQEKTVIRRSMFAAPLLTALAACQSPADGGAGMQEQISMLFFTTKIVGTRSAL